MGTLPDVGDAKRDVERAGDLLILVTKKAKLVILSEFSTTFVEDSTD